MKYEWANEGPYQWLCSELHFEWQDLNDFNTIRIDIQQLLNAEQLATSKMWMGNSLFVVGVDGLDNSEIPETRNTQQFTC